ncbi:uncharacterized protein [Anas platyrhynchos]|uniref:uncharacterized protein n=1 Tax=Anas platyrhynchos TaxID=8839 RepID=UPI003AF29FA2
MSKDKHGEKDSKLHDLCFCVLHFDNANPKRKTRRKRRRKRRKKRNSRKVKGSLEHLDPRFQKITREKKEESHPPDGSSCEQCRSESSKQPYKEGKPSSAGESKKYTSVSSNECIKVSRTLRNLLGRMNTSHSTNVMTVETRRNQEDQKNMTSFLMKMFCTAKRLLSLRFVGSSNFRLSFRYTKFSSRISGPVLSVCDRLLC